ncbi:hypothetical protein [Actimicrobium sp. CCI2.3]|uniref:hypothetical protein n=1 Tax=Actimicrobium sp. CCI2.3 TaxID=3048616 RepID=UPI002B24FD7C|nr:hypothetical protein [Actimicrobium sp. CCI2.3]MEB0021494.1 hypothetical protein [Actimicrobium sp. CCI2.3]
MSNVEFAEKKRVTRRGSFLANIEQVMTWVGLEAVIAPNYPTDTNDRRTLSLSRMARVYRIKQ